MLTCTVLLSVAQKNIFSKGGLTVAPRKVFKFLEMEHLVYCCTFGFFVKFKLNFY